VADPDLAEQVASLYSRSGVRAHQLALLLTGDRGAAEDVVQEAFLRLVGRLEEGALGRAPALEAHGALDGYLLRTVRNLALNHQRKGQAAARAEAKLGAPLLEPAPGASAPDPDERAALEQALLGLPPEQREVVHLRVWEGLSFPEVAARTDAPLGTVHSRYRYAMERLRALMGSP
jgi:RNA polymerase sigma-70 factor (ECF subfamily)